MRKKSLYSFLLLALSYFVYLQWAVVFEHMPHFAGQYEMVATASMVVWALIWVATIDYAISRSDCGICILVITTIGLALSVVKYKYYDSFNSVIMSVNSAAEITNLAGSVWMLGAFIFHLIIEALDRWQKEEDDAYDKELTEKLRPTLSCSVDSGSSMIQINPDAGSQSQTTESVRLEKIRPSDVMPPPVA